MKIILAITTLAIITLSGCSSYRPIPTHKYIDDKIANKVVTTDYQGKDDSNSPKVTVKLSTIDTLNSKEDLMKLLNSGRLEFMTKAESLYGSINNASDTAYAGTIIGLLGGVTSSIETVVAGSVLGVVGSVAPTRYNLNIQADNYKKMGDAYLCIMKKVRYTKHFNVYPDKEDAIQSIVYTLSDLEHELFNRQTKVILGEVDMSALITSIDLARKEKDNKTKAYEEVEALGNNSKAATKAEAVNLYIETEKDTLLADVKVCEELF